MGLINAESSVNYTFTSHDENLTLRGTTALTGLGNDLDNVIKGNARNDTLDGDRGGDVLIGGAGNDRLIGGAGADRFTGGIGADRFVFTALSNSMTVIAGRDTITDFNPAQHDQIYLSIIDANMHLDGNAFLYLGDAAFTGRVSPFPARGRRRHFDLRRWERRRGRRFCHSA